MNTAAKTVTNKKTLAQIVDDFRRILYLADENEGEVLPELEQELSACEEALESKVDKCLWFWKELTAQAEVYAERAKMLEDRSRVLKKQAERLKNHVHASMLNLGIPKLETEHFVASVANSPTSVQIADDYQFALEQIKSKTPKQCTYCFTNKLPFVTIKAVPDKKEILEYVKEGYSLSNIVLMTSTHLRVK